MTNEYAPRQFLRHAKIALVSKFFNRRSVLAHLDWENMSEADVEPIYRAWQGLPEQAREEIEWTFRRIYGIATADGTHAIIEEGRFHGLDLSSDLDSLDGHVNKALWTFLEHPKVFAVSAILNRADHLNGRYWRKRLGLPLKEPDVSPEALSELAAAVSAYYWENQGRGQNCRPEAYLRAERYHYFFVYPQDYTDTFVGYTNDGAFERRPQNPAFEVIFVYDATDGSLELYVRGDKKIVGDLQKLFGRAILHEELGEENRNAIPYNLNVLKRRDFSFPTDPRDGVRGVKVPSLRLSLVGNRRKRITFETDPKDPKDAIHDFIDSVVDDNRVPRSMLDVSSAVIQMLFENTNDSRRETKPVSFRISFPNSCNLKDSPEELIAKKYLKEWKIDCL